MVAMLFQYIKWYAAFMLTSMQYELTRSFYFNQLFQRAAQLTNPVSPKRMATIQPAYWRAATPIKSSSGSCIWPATPYLIESTNELPLTLHGIRVPTTDVGKCSAGLNSCIGMLGCACGSHLTLSPLSPVIWLCRSVERCLCMSIVPLFIYFYV